MSENTTPENIVPIPAEGVADAPAAEQPKPQTIQELVAAIDISGVSEHEIITDLIAGIQQLALRGTIALGLLERLATENQPEEPAADEEAPKA